jgi:hypothetical protein
MAEITTALVHENEIAKADDFLHGFTSLIKNTAVLDRMLVSANIDYIIGGEVFPDSASLGIRVQKLWGNGNGHELPVFLGEVSDIIPLILPMADNRIDTLQVKCEFEEYDKQRRSFYNPDLTVGQYFAVYTKMRLKTIFEVKQGAEGQDIAPDADTGWVKLAEICLEPGLVTLPEENIKTITAIYQGENNGDWTNQKNRTFNLGSFLDLKTMFGKEHTVDGHHRDRVITANNIAFGIGSNEVNAKKIPLGQNYNIDNEVYEETDSIRECLMKEGLYRKAAISILQAFHHWSENYQYSPADPCFYDGNFYYADETNIPIPGENPETHPLKWNAIGEGAGATYIPTPNRVTKFDDSARLRSGYEAIEPYHVVRKRELNLRVTTLQLYSNKSLLMSNARQALRRQRGWDMGIPYPTQFSEVYHFDTDLLDQNQHSSISIIGDNLQLAGKDDILDKFTLFAAIVGIPPYEVISKSLLGNFKITKNIPASENSTVEFWIRPLTTDNHILFRIGTATDSVLMYVGLADPEYSEPVPGDPHYSIAYDEDPEYCIAKVAGSILEHLTINGTESIVMLDAQGMDPEYSEAASGDPPYNFAAFGDPIYSVATEYEAIVDIDENKWIHFAVVNTKQKLSVYINDKRFDFQKFSYDDMPVSAIFNENLGIFNIDELFIDSTIALGFPAFAENTIARLPYAALDHQEKWFILEAEDINKVKTNLFETDAFRAAVEAVINNI